MSPCALKYQKQNQICIGTHCKYHLEAKTSWECMEMLAKNLVFCPLEAWLFSEQHFSFGHSGWCFWSSSRRSILCTIVVAVFACKYQDNHCREKEFCLPVSNFVFYTWIEKQVCRFANTAFRQTSLTHPICSVFDADQRGLFFPPRNQEGLKP